MGWFDDNHFMGARAQGYESDGDGGYMMDLPPSYYSNSSEYSGGGSRKRGRAKSVSFSVEVAKSNRIKCSLNSCVHGTTIQKGDLKISKTTYSDYGAAKQGWRHAECFFCRKTQDLKELHQIAGLNSLDTVQRARVVSLYNRKYHGASLALPVVPVAPAAAAARQSLPVSPVAAAPTVAPSSSGTAATAAIVATVATAVAVSMAGPSTKKAKTAAGQPNLMSFFKIHVLQTTCFSQHEVYTKLPKC